MREVVLENETTMSIDDITTSKGYVMSGDKADFILSKDVDGKFIWVRVTPGKIGKPVHRYDSMKDAIADKLEKGYSVFEYSSAVFG